MNTHDIDIELPPLPPLHIVPSVAPVDYPEVAQAFVDYARAAVEADRKRRGEPVELDRYDAGYLGGQDGMPAYVWHDIIRAELDRAYDFYMDQLDRAAPQPAEPVKVPSDDDIEQLAKQFGFHRVPGTIELARDVLARYGQLAEPEGWQLVPVELTYTMMYAGAAARLTLDDPEEDVQGIWKAMLAAAPKFGEEE